MATFSVLSSFLSASSNVLQSDIDVSDSDKTGTGDSSFFAPGMDNCVLAPYNFKFN